MNIWRLIIRSHNITVNTKHNPILTEACKLLYNENGFDEKLGISTWKEVLEILKHFAFLLTWKKIFKILKLFCIPSKEIHAYFIALPVTELVNVLWTDDGGVTSLLY